MAETEMDACSRSSEILVSRTEESDKLNSVDMVNTIFMLNVTEQDYLRELWPKISHAVQQLLTCKPGEFLPLSYEQVYSCVYKCVCKQFSDQLYQDLLNLVTDHLLSISAELTASESAKEYVEKFNIAMERYFQSVQGIVSVFNYMNRFYIESKLGKDLLTELQKLFIVNVSDRHLQTLFQKLDEVQVRSFSVSPAVLSSLVNNLYKLKPEYSQHRLQLFARFIPNILPPCTVANIEHYKQEVQQMKRDLLTQPDFISGDQGRKRQCDDDYSSVLMSDFDASVGEFKT